MPPVGRYGSPRRHGYPSPSDLLDEDDLPPMEDVSGQPSTSSANAASPTRPQRTRKRNKFIFGDEEEEYTTSSVVRHSRGPKTTPVKLNLPGPPSHSDRGVDKNIAKRLGMSLRTLLKLPKAHKWVCYEWFYGNIDLSLFHGENDFEMYLRESFPQLKTRMLKKVEWSKIRRLMGKPRRCSPAFFKEERDALNAKRNKIRHLQQQKVVDISMYRDLPANIPLPLVIGARVTALLRAPSDGLFTGTITAVDTVSGCYRIQFDRPGLGSHQVPDYEVLPCDTAEFMPLASFQSKVRQRLPLMPNRIYEVLGNHPDQEGTTTTGTGSTKVKTEQGVTSDSGMLGGFPVKFLIALVKLSKILSVKKRKIYELKSMNTEAEKMRSLQEPIPHEFQKVYANTILDLEKLNVDLDDYLKTTLHFASEMMADSTVGLNSLEPEILKKRLLYEAKDFAERSLLLCNVRNEKTIDTISHLLSIMLHLRNFSDSEVSSFELKTLSEVIMDTKNKVLLAENRGPFESQVEIHVNHIQSSLSHLGNLGAFAESLSQAGDG